MADLFDQRQQDEAVNSLIKAARQEEEARRIEELNRLANQYTFDSGLLVERTPSISQGILSYDIAPPGNVDLETAVMTQMAQQLKPQSPAEATIKGLEVGDIKSNEINQRGFFDKLFSKETAMGLLDIFAQPEFIQAQRGLGGVSPLAAFSLAAAGKRQREAAAMAKEQEEATKLQLEAIKKSGAGRELLAKPEVQRLITQSRSTFNMIKDVGKLTKIFGEGKTSGAVPILKDSLVNLANIFGFNLDQTSKQTAKSIIAAIKAEQAAARTFGRELSQRDYDILERVLAEPDLLSSDSALRASYFRFLKKVQGAHQQTVRSLNMIVGPEISRGILSPSQYQGSLVRSVEQGN